MDSTESSLCLYDIMYLLGKPLTHERHLIASHCFIKPLAVQFSLMPASQTHHSGISRIPTNKTHTLTLSAFRNDMPNFFLSNLTSTPTVSFSWNMIFKVCKRVYSHLVSILLLALEMKIDLVATSIVLCFFFLAIAFTRTVVVCASCATFKYRKYSLFSCHIFQLMHVLCRASHFRHFKCQSQQKKKRQIHMILMFGVCLLRWWYLKSHWKAFDCHNPGENAKQSRSQFA